VALPTSIIPQSGNHLTGSQIYNRRICSPDRAVEKPQRRRVAVACPSIFSVIFLDPPKTMDLRFYSSGTRPRHPQWLLIQAPVKIACAVASCAARSCRLRTFRAA
jgi:hypothetical protein